MLKDLPFFEGVPAEIIAEIQQSTSEKQISQNNFVCKEGEPGSEMYVVLEGRLAAYKNISGKSTRIGSIEAGDFFCETSLITNSPRNASVITEMPTRLLSISQEAFAKIFGKYPEISEKVSKAIIDRSEEANHAEIQMKREKYKYEQGDDSGNRPLTISI